MFFQRLHWLLRFQAPEHLSWAAHLGVCLLLCCEAVESGERRGFFHLTCPAQGEDLDRGWRIEGMACRVTLGVRHLDCSCDTKSQEPGSELRILWQGLSLQVWPFCGGGRQLNHVLGLAHHWFSHHSTTLRGSNTYTVAGTVWAVVMKTPVLQGTYSQLGEKMSQLMPKDAWWMLRQNMCSGIRRAPESEEAWKNAWLSWVRNHDVRWVGRRGMGILGRENSMN